MENRTATCMLLSVSIIAIRSSTLAGQEYVAIGGDSVLMRLELVLDEPVAVLHQNFTFTVRIVNPNEFPVELRGFEMDSYVEPEVHLLQNGEESIHLRYHATDSAWTRVPVVIRPGDSVVKRRFLWNDNLASLWWPDSVGFFKLRLGTHLSTASVSNRAEQLPIKWESPITEIHVVAPSRYDEGAWNWLEPQLKSYSDSLKNPKKDAESPAVRKVRIFAEFLGLFPDSAHAPAIRWETVKLLLQMGKETVEPMAELFDRSLTFCLEKGGAYAEDFLEWNLESGGNRAMNLAIELWRVELAERIVRVLDERYPEDEAAKLIRRARVVGHKESGEAARVILGRVVEEYPGSPSAEVARKQIEHIDRGWWPPRPPDDEQRSYRAAVRETDRSPENGRLMLEAHLKQFPEGRYSTQIRELIQAIDEGTWPPPPRESSNERNQ